MSECLESVELEQIHVERSTDAALVRRVITHPRVYPHVADDSAPTPEEFDASDAVKHPNIHFLCVYDVEELLGLFMVHQHNGVLYEVHTCLLPCGWGKRAKKAGLVTLRWIFQNIGCEKLITLVPQGNTLALRFARGCGLKVEGIITGSYRKNGKLLDQTLLGIARGDVCL